MKNLLAFTVFLIFLFSGCATVDENKSAAMEKKTEVKEVQKEDFGKIGNEFLSWCRNEQKASENLAAQIKNAKNKTASEILALLNQIEIKQTDALCKSGIYELNHPDEGMRNASMVCEQEFIKQTTEFSLDTDLYKAISLLKMDDASLSEEDKYYLNDVISDFKRNGVDKDEKTRDELKKLSVVLSEFEQEYYKNIGADRKRIIVETELELKGLPDEFINSHKTAEGNYQFTTDWPDYFPIMQFAQNPKLREEMWKAKLNIAYPANSEIFDKLLKARKKWANLLGYKNWAEFSEEKLMIENPTNADNFINKVAELSKAYSDRDMNIMLNYKKKDSPETTTLEPWDKAFYPVIVTQDKYNFNPKDASKYFEIKKVKDGLFNLFEKLYGIKIVEIKREDVWHPTVQSYNVTENGNIIGTFDLDLYPRENKYKHFAMFTNELGVRDVRLPRGAIIGNFPKPVNGKAYLTHEDVETLFHEFGHLMHMIFAGNNKYLRFSGTSCQHDFVEVPSQLMEEWSWNPEVLQSFATDDDGNPIPTEMIEKMKNANEFAKAVNVRQQMYYAILSLKVYTTDPEGMDHHALEKELEAKYSPWKSYSDTNMIESFGHLIGYSSNYYTYMWSLVIVKDLAEEIKKGGMMNSELMTKYRKAILEKGGSQKAADMVKEFLGRDTEFKAFENWLNQ